MNFELDDVVEDLFDLGVEFFAQGVGAEGQLFESREGGRYKSVCRNRPVKSRIEVAYLIAYTVAHAVMFYLLWSWRKEGDLLDVGIHLTLLH